MSLEELEEKLVTKIVGHAKTIEKVMEAVNRINNTATLVFTEEGLEINEMDPTRSAMIIVEISKEFFDEYLLGTETSEDEGKKRVSVGINVTELLTALKLSKKDDTVEITVQDNGKIMVTLRNDSLKRIFSLPTIPTEGSLGKKLKIPFDLEVEFSTAMYRDMIRALSIGGETVVLKGLERKLLATSGTPYREILYEIPIDSPEVMKYMPKTTDLPVKATYSFKYLKEIEKGTKIADLLTLEYATDRPLRITYKNDDGNIVMAYAIAPRLEY